MGPPADRSSRRPACLHIGVAGESGLDPQAIGLVEATDGRPNEPSARKEVNKLLRARPGLHRVGRRSSRCERSWRVWIATVE
jgi:hypothetical protein